MDNKQYTREIDELERTKRAWSRTRKDKQAVRDLLSSIGVFNHVFTARFTLAQSYYNRNDLAEIEITDGINDLEHYAESKLKQKDDRYYYSGMSHIQRRIDTIINRLKLEQEQLSKKNAP